MEEGEQGRWCQVTISLEAARRTLYFEEDWYDYCGKVAKSFAKSYNGRVDEEDLAQHLRVTLFEKKDRLLADTTPDGKIITDAYIKKSLQNIATNYVNKELDTYYRYSGQFVYTNPITRNLLEQWIENPIPEIADEGGSDEKSIWAMFADMSSAFERLNAEHKAILLDVYLNGKVLTGTTEKRKFQKAIDRLTVLLNKARRVDDREYIGARKVMSNREAVSATKGALYS